MSMLPQLSAASQVTNFGPIVKFDPDDGLQITVMLSPELSEAEGYCQTATVYGWPGLVNNT